MSKKKEIKDPKNVEPTYKEAEGYVDSVGSQGGYPYIIIKTSKDILKKIFLGPKNLVKIEIL